MKIYYCYLLTNSSSYQENITILERMFMMQPKNKC